VPLAQLPRGKFFFALLHRLMLVGQHVCSEKHLASDYAVAKSRCVETNNATVARSGSPFPEKIEDGPVKGSPYKRRK
jgi:hypothetical protein